VIDPTSSAATPSADRNVDRLYGSLRGRFGTGSARANGYRYHGYFLREQSLVLAALGPPRGVVLDIACGSGLMLKPLLSEADGVIGVDYNEHACGHAHANGLLVVRGDAFSLPLRSGSVDMAVNCQFLNQQDQAAARRFIEEVGRVLKSGSRLVLVWRNGSSLIHRVAHAVFRLFDRLSGLPTFPCIDHGLEEIRAYALAAGLSVEAEAAAFPPLSWWMNDPVSPSARLFGASYFMVVHKPGKVPLNASRT
jgi:SAM-dependent methyltransferase